jgi:hypothetical protein
MDQPENVPFVFCQLFYQLLRTLSEPPISSAVSSRVHSRFLLEHDPQLAGSFHLISLPQSLGLGHFSADKVDDWAGLT